MLSCVWADAWAARRLSLGLSVPVWSRLSGCLLNLCLLLFSSSSSGHEDQSPGDSQHPAADGGLPHPGSHSPPHSSAAPGVVSSRVFFFFFIHSPEQRGTQKWNLFLLIFLFFFPVFLQPGVVCAERQALNSISSPYFSLSLAQLSLCPSLSGYPLPSF